MSTLRLLFAEIRFRKINFFLALLAVTAAVTLLVAGPVLVEGYGRQASERLNQYQHETSAKIAQMQDDADIELAAMEQKTTRLMRDMGFNLMIMHQDTNMADFWAADFTTADMPQDYVQKLADEPSLTLITHLVASLQKKIEWNDRSVLLVGYLPETTQWHRERKSPMGYNIEAGTVLLGHELGIGREVGEKVDVLGKELTVARILPQQGSKEDIVIAVHLDDAQAMLDKQGRVTQILALGCRCSGERLPQIRGQLSSVLPDTQIIEFRSIAVARAEQRDLVRDQRQAIINNMARERVETQEMMASQFSQTQGLLETLASVVSPLVVLISAVWVGLLALSNVRERRQEIGLLRALGKGTSRIAGLFLGRAVLLGVLGAVIGFFAGVALAKLLGALPDLGVTPQYLSANWQLFVATLIGAPLLSALASYLPTLMAVVQDPAVVLQDH
ncbi:MAG: FtsX-like permease family protein [Pirellulales bacterium]